MSVCALDALNVSPRCFMLFAMVGQVGCRGGTCCGDLPSYPDTRQSSWVMLLQDLCVRG